MWIYVIYIVVTIIITSLLAFKAYIKFNYPFWSIMPIHHSYNIFYKFYKPGIINSEPPDKDKWCNLINIKTVNYQHISPKDIKSFTEFIKANYKSNNSILYKPQDHNILSYFNSHNASCYLSYYYEKTASFVATKEMTNDIIGVIASYPLYISINRLLIDVYYIDFLCVDKGQKGLDGERELIPHLIQTHIYHGRRKNKNIQIYLFKRENNITIPTTSLVTYRTYNFSMKLWSKDIIIPATHQLIEINSKNFFNIRSILQNTLTNYFSCIIIPSFSNILELVSSKNILIFTFNYLEDILAVYIFRETNIIQHGGKTIECVATINNCEDDLSFILGFKSAIIKLRKIYENIIIEDISHTTAIIINILLKHKPSRINTETYFLYNFIQPSFDPKQCIIIH